MKWDSKNLSKLLLANLQLALMHAWLPHSVDFNETLVLIYDDSFPHSSPFQLNLYSTAPHCPILEKIVNVERYYKLFYPCTKYSLRDSSNVRSFCYQNQIKGNRKKRIPIQRDMISVSNSISLNFLPVLHLV